MDPQTANAVLGYLEYDVITIQGAFYRKLRPSALRDRLNFNVSRWTPPERGWETTAQQLGGARRQNNVWEEASDNMSSSDSCDETFTSVVEDSEGYYATTVFPRSRLGRLIGKGGKTIQQLESQYSVKIHVRGVEIEKSVNAYEDTNSTTTLLTIRSARRNAADVEGALRAITSLRAEQVTLNPTTKSFRRPTHFIALPILDAAFRQQVLSFQELVKNKGYLGIHNPKLFQRPERLHLTLCVLTLETVEDVNHAITIFSGLQQAVYDAVKTRTLWLEFRGVETMTDDVTQTSLIVTKPFSRDSSEMTSRIDAMTATMTQALIQGAVMSWDDLHRQRLIASDERTVHANLHVTLLNTTFTSSSEKQFDAGKLVREFSLMFFGKVTFNQVHLFSMRKVDPNTKSYRSLAVLRLP